MSPLRLALATCGLALLAVAACGHLPPTVAPPPPRIGDDFVFGSIEQVWLSGKASRTLSPDGQLGLELELVSSLSPCEELLLDASLLDSQAILAQVRARLGTTARGCISTLVFQLPPESRPLPELTQSSTEEPTGERKLWLQLGLQGASGESLTAIVSLPLQLANATHRGSEHFRATHGSTITEALHCPDGRWVLRGPGGVHTYLPGAESTVQVFDIAVQQMLVDARCTRAYLSTAGSFAVVDLLNARTLFKQRVENLLAIVRDPNPRYLLLLSKSGELRRFFLRDLEWSKYNGALSAAPLVDEQGAPLLDFDGRRLLIATQSGELCLLTDRKTVQPECVTLDTDFVDLLLLPFGFAEPPGVPYLPERIGFADEFEAASTRGAVLLLGQSGELRLASLDDASVLGRWTLLSPSTRLLRTSEQTLLASSTTAFQTLDLFDQGFVWRLPDDATDSALAHFTDTARGDVLRHGEGLRAYLRQSLGVVELVDPEGRVLGFVANGPWQAHWAPDGELLLSNAEHVLSPSLDGLTCFEEHRGQACSPSPRP